MKTTAERLTWALKHRGKSIRSFQKALKDADVRGSSYPNVHAIFQGKTEPPMSFIQAAAKELKMSAAWLAFAEGYPDQEIADDQKTRQEAHEAAHESAPGRPTGADIQVPVARTTTRALAPKVTAGGDAETRDQGDETRERLSGKLENAERVATLKFKWSVLSPLLDIEKVVLEGTPQGEGEMTVEETWQHLHGWAQRLNFSFIPSWVPPLMEVRRRYGRKTIDPKALGLALRASLVKLGIEPAKGMDDTYRTEDWLDDFITGMVPVLLALAPERKRQHQAPPVPADVASGIGRWITGGEADDGS